MNGVQTNAGYSAKGTQVSISTLTWIAAVAFLAGLWPLPVSSQPVPTGFQTVDLSRFYTTVYSTNTSPEPAVAWGTQTLAGIPFAIGGRIEVTGIDAARHGQFFPPQVTGIGLHARAARIHLVHGAAHGQKDGIPLANLVLHFEGGEAKTIRLAFGVHARNYLEESTTKTALLADPNSRIVWEQARSVTNLARLFLTTLDNPFPDREITTIDLVSLFSQATPVVFAITLDRRAGLEPLAALPKRKVVQHANQFADSVYRASLKLRVTDASSGNPVTNGSAILTVNDDSKSFFFGQYVPDSRGVIEAAYPPQQAVSLSLRMSSPGFVAGAVLLSMQNGEKWPEAVEVKMKRGTSIGGLVLDSQGTPISNATVIPFEISKASEKQYTRTDLDVVKTGPDGKWQAVGQSESLSNLSFQIEHPDYHSKTYPQLAPADLLTSKATATLDPYPHMVGGVINGQGEPIPGSGVILDYGGDNHVVQTADKQGRFSFVVRDPTNNSAAIIVIATNYAPVQRTIAFDSPPGPVIISVDPGSTFRMAMVDQSGAPMAGVKVTLERWNGSRAMQWKTQTDSQGRFIWEHAPEGSVTFRYEKTGHSIHTHSMTLPVNGEMRYSYSRTTRLAGKVVDAQTKKPIDQFSYVLRYRYTNSQPRRWYRYNSGTGRRGTFSTSPSSGMSDAEWSLVVEARGYEPILADFSPSNGSLSNVFEMKRGKPIIGVVTTTNGAVIAKADVVILDASESAYMDVPGKFRKSMSYYEVVNTSANGRFELTQKIDADLVVACHTNFGYAQISLVELMKTGKIVLQPWGSVTGVVRVGEKIEPYYRVALHSSYEMEMIGNRSQPAVNLYLQSDPAPDGRFSFPTVPPGNRIAYLRYVFEKNERGNMKLSHNVPVPVKPGETNEVMIGGTGRTVFGKIQVTGGTGSEIDWHRDSHTMRIQPRPVGVPPPMSFPPNATAEERQELIKKRNQQLQDFYREQQQRINRMQRTYVLVFGSDGSFLVHNVEPGPYMLEIRPTDATQPNSYRYLGNLNTTINVPEGTAPHDLGTFNLTIR